MGLTDNPTELTILVFYPCCQPGGGVYGEYFTNSVGNDTIEEDKVEDIIENLSF